MSIHVFSLLFQTSLIWLIFQLTDSLLSFLLSYLSFSALPRWGVFHGLSFPLSIFHQVFTDPVSKIKANVCVEPPVECSEFLQVLLYSLKRIRFLRNQTIKLIQETGIIVFDLKVVTNKKQLVYIRLLPSIYIWQPLFFKRDENFTFTTDLPQLH